MANVGNPSLFSGATAVQSLPKSQTFTVDLAVFCPLAKMASKTVEGTIWYSTVKRKGRKPFVNGVFATQHSYCVCSSRKLGLSVVQQKHTTE